MEMTNIKLKTKAQSVLLWTDQSAIMKDLSAAVVNPSGLEIAHRTICLCYRSGRASEVNPHRLASPSF